MKFLDALRQRRSGGGAPAQQTNSADAADLPIRGYDKLNESQVNARLDLLTQVELEAVETYERSHGDRPPVLDKLRYMRMDEPLPGYDGLSVGQITEALADADAETVKGVRDYERKFGHRPEVMDEAARVLRSAKASPEEEKARAARAALVKEGFASRTKTADDLSR